MMRPRKRRTSFRCGHATLLVAAGVAGEALVAPPVVATGRPALLAVGWLPPPQPPRARAAAAIRAAMTAARRVMTSASPLRAPTMQLEVVGSNVPDGPQEFALVTVGHL
jgi:hypothetical protein